MNVSLAWLREFVATRTPAPALGEKFRMTSSECEGVIDWTERFEGLVVGYVEAVQPHPNADKLRVATVNVGSEKATIVCGAANLEKSQTVIVALPGTTINPVGHDQVTIEKAEIRGVTSEGMLCGLEEIGLPLPSGRNIFVFETEIKPGTPVASALFENDSVIDLEITPNRPDLLSHVGLAREVAAFEGLKLTLPPVATIEPQRSYPVSFSLKLSNHKECLRYSGIAVEVEVKPSPWGMQSRLLRAGIRPINTVVDVTNYVMLELGQPMHAFDVDKLISKDSEFTFEIRLARTGECIELLDGSTRKLTSDDIIITDADDVPIDLAGIMGGKESSISETTTRVFLEAASFNNANIRKTSRRLGLRSEASLRFEKGIDCELTDRALKRALYLLKEIAGAKVISKHVDSRVHPPVRPHIHVSFEDINRILGVRISAGDCKEILHKLGFELQNFTKSGFTVIPPTWRKDVTQLEDIIEELIRIWGYQRLPYTLPAGAVKSPRKNESVSAKYLLRHLLASEGMHETLHLTLTSESALKACAIDPKTALPVRNPLSTESAYLSPSHVIGMLGDCGSVNAGEEELGLFEIGKMFLPPSEEHEHLTILLRTAKNPEAALRILKATLNRVAQILSLTKFTYRTGKDLPYGEHGQTLDIFSDSTMIGKLSLISDEVVSAHKIRRGRDIFAAEVNLDVLLGIARQVSFYQPVPTFPISERDITVTVPAATPLGELLAVVDTTVNPDIVRDWHVATIFSGKPLPEGSKAITLRLTYNSSERTLSDDEIKAHHTKLEQALHPFTQAL
jgi:phenylalanyl-tRNA synthetase beta chain